MFKLSPGLALAAFSLLGLLAFLFVKNQQLSDALADRNARLPSVVDIGFSQSMLRHHQQAIILSQLLLDGNPTQLAGMARHIVATQSIELGEMQGWLRLWNQPLVEPGEPMQWIELSGERLDDSLVQYLADCGESAEGMPGLATREQLVELQRAIGRPRDRLFIELMLEHHKGGLPMAQFAERAAKLTAVKNLAKRITQAQSREVAQLESMLRIMDRHEQAAGPDRVDAAMLGVTAQ